MVGGFTTDMLTILANMVVVVPGRGVPILPARFSHTSSVNIFKSSDGLARYLHIFTPEGESGASIRMRGSAGMYPVSAEIINGGGGPRPIKIVPLGAELHPGEMMVGTAGTVNIKLPDIKPGFAMIRIQYEEREQEQD